MTEDFEYHNNKLPSKTYVSRSIETQASSNAPGRRIRIASKVFDTPETHSYVLERGEAVIKITPGGRQGVVAKFYEDDRHVFQLVIQRFVGRGGRQTREAFSFRGEEIPRLLKFLLNLRQLSLISDDGINVTDAELEKLLLIPDQVRQLISQNEEAVIELARSSITKSDIIALGYRKRQLEVFKSLLEDESTDEPKWQSFFEANKWVFGYGLTFVWTSNLDDRRLQQIVAGSSVWGKGKIADSLLKSRGAIESLCFVEIKKRTTKLLRSSQYRPACWPPSEELSGGVVQAQVTVELALRGMADKLETYAEDGAPTGEQLFTYQPRSFLVIGSLNEFNTTDGVNKEKYRSFELYRRSISRPEIITFDEIYERASAIVESDDHENQALQRS